MGTNAKVDERFSFSQLRTWFGTMSAELKSFAYIIHWYLFILRAISAHDLSNLSPAHSNPMYTVDWSFMSSADFILKLQQWQDSLICIT